MRLTQLAFLGLSLVAAACRGGGGDDDDNPTPDGPPGGEDVTIQEVQNDAMAVGNQFQTDSNAAIHGVTNFQSNRAPVNATANVNVANTGPADISSTAVGNTAQIVSYTTGP